MELGPQVFRSTGQPALFYVDPFVPPALFGNHLVDELQVASELPGHGRRAQVVPQREKVRTQRRLVGGVKRPLIGGGQEDVAAQQRVVLRDRLGQAQNGRRVLGRNDPAARCPVLK